MAPGIDRTPSDRVEVGRALSHLPQLRDQPQRNVPANPQLTPAPLTAVLAMRDRRNVDVAAETAPKIISNPTPICHSPKLYLTKCASTR